MVHRSSTRWLAEHSTDHYVKQAKLAGYRSRAAYKLLALQDKYRLFKPGMLVVELGAAPGSWSQVLVQLVGSGNVLAVDLLAMAPICGVEILQGDITESATQQRILTLAQQRQSMHWVVTSAN